MTLQRTLELYLFGVGGYFFRFGLGERLLLVFVLVHNPYLGNVQRFASCNCLHIF